MRRRIYHIYFTILTDTAGARCIITGSGEQFISFTRDKGFAERWASKNGTSVASVDLDAIHKANKMAKGVKEVLVEGEIPNKKTNMEGC